MDENIPLVSNFGFNPILDCEYPYDLRKLRYSDDSLDHSISSEIESPSDDGDFSGTVLKYINQILMVEDMDAKHCMFHDPLALQATEKSLYEVLGEEYLSSPDQHPLCYTGHSVESPDDRFGASAADSIGIFSHTGVSLNSFSKSFDRMECESSTLQNPISDGFVFQSSSQSLPGFSSKFGSNGSGLRGGLNTIEFLVQNSICENEAMLQFKRGLEEGSKFLPKVHQLVIDLEDNSFSQEAKENIPSVLVKAEKDEIELSPNESRERKNHDRDEKDLEGGRSKKQLAVYTEETKEEIELSELFDKVLLCDRGREDRERRCNKTIESNPNSKANQSALLGERSNKTSSSKTRAKIQDNDKEVVDLRTLLISCAQAVSDNDFRSSYELLKQIRQHSSPLGDGYQRMAHYFANGLEARLAGTGSEIYAALAWRRTSTTDLLRAYQAYISACPFKKISIIFANVMIFKTAEKAEKLHIIDFGILYGFQWPAFIYYLSKRSCGPPKLRITGIELPQNGFRPAERVQETGNRLARYCERFGVPFEYDAISKKFENVQIEDLKIDKDEMLAVTCLLRFKNLLDETVVEDSPRDAVLNLIRKLNPDIFVHTINSGSYAAPFFIPRFREALFNFSSFFDLADSTFSREDAMRLMFEKEFLGREVINVVACEGSERVERPETYKQWHVRTLRAGFRPLPLDSAAMRKLKGKVKRGYHSDFVVEEDGSWMLQGWKGRVLYASSCWVPV